MGRNRIRSEADDKEYQKIYQREYYLARKDADREYYKATFSRTYFRKVLRNLSDGDPKREKIEQKITALTNRINELKDSRNKYARLDICDRVNAKIHQSNTESE